jgi:hypothetical protein
MRVTVLYVCLFLLLLCGVSTVQASAHRSVKTSGVSTNSSRDDRSKFANKNHSHVGLEDIDLDLDDELLSDHEGYDHSSSYLLIREYSVPGPWYLQSSSSDIFFQDNKRFSASPHSFGTSHPIYITQRILRL